MNTLSLLSRVLNPMKLKMTSARACSVGLVQYYSNTLNHNQQLIDNHLHMFVQYQFHKPTVERMLTKHIEWSRISPTELKNTVDVLQSYKFTVNDITDILETAPDTCSIEKNTLIDILEEWLTCQFSTERLIALLSVQPILLKINKEHISERIPTYLLIFKNNRNKLLVFLKLCPEIMLENFDAIIEKYNYIRHKMELKPNELLNSRALCFDMNFIMTRHMFLDRSGQYSYRTKNMSAHEDLGNPTMNAIFDTTDELFAEKIAKLSLIEYETFCSYFAQEEISDVDSDEDK